ncbi:hypothetical protein QQS45_02815 [Alteriqipengyuania flavescens]|uniref:hypothetical protein n=1 Tax=Alteriqipengyuania flavescens TaxID=3053610 RepID=UPI0025B47C0C|nr:hypothetical protein [Alteriqipengyuania flavescens]WJY19184.1 hypothetical protein QQW98_02810 [Alteriqipengyuania flavescens]WJY25124.1 hypothetical protein QQS45_02815 [Alteriqipengyuania flavescens]
MSIFRTFLQNLSPRRAVSDFAGQWRRPNPYRWHILGVAGAATFAIFYTFLPEDQPMEPESPEVDYIEFFEPGRTDEQIMASNVENQKRQDELRAEAEERVELRKSLYRELGRATGLDVDEMERELAAEEAAEKAAEQQRLDARRRDAERALLDGQ